MQVKTFQLLEKHISRLYDYTRQKKYVILLFSFMLLIFGNTFEVNFRILIIACIYQNLVRGFIVFYDKKRLRTFILCIILISVALDLYEISVSYVDFRRWHSILYLIFFSLVSKEVYKEVLYVKAVSREMLAAALCGFVLLCLIATFLFIMIETEVPHSFANAGEGRFVLDNLTYFSFTTLLTIGFGDITPVSLLAKRAVMFIGLAGHFYTVFITSIIIGKYLSAKEDAAET